MSNDVVRVETFTSETQAYHAQALLKEADINATIAEPDDGAFGFSLDVVDHFDLIVNVSDLESAKKILEEMEEMEDGELAPAWTCKCGEQVDEGFAVCWSCGAVHPGEGSSQDNEGTNP